MKNYLSIGEIAKLSNLSVQTLRHYDKLGLLKPTIVRDNGYRYYSLEQFFKLDFIRFYKNLGLSLMEINGVLSQSATIENTLELLQSQEDEIDKQIKALEKQKSLIRKKTEHVKVMLDKPIETAFLTRKPKRKLIKINMENKHLEDAEMSFRKVLNGLPQLSDPLTFEMIYEINYETFKEKDEVKYNNYFIVTDEALEEHRDIRFSEMMEGTYASILYFDYYGNNPMYIKGLFRFIEAKNLRAEGPLYESYIASELCDEKEKLLMEIFIKVNKID